MLSGFLLRSGSTTRSAPRTEGIPASPFPNSAVTER